MRARGYLSQLIYALCWFTTIAVLVTGGILWKQFSDDTITGNSSRIFGKDATSAYLLDMPQLHFLAPTDPCQKQYDWANLNRTRGLTQEDLEHSRALIGNRYRLSVLAESLGLQKPITAVVCGGSISLGHGIFDQQTRRYSHRLEEWFNNAHPLPTNDGARHKVLNHGSHGADMCAMAKRVNILLDDLKPTVPDLFILEFAVNDYQGQDFKIHLDHKTSVFFDGFERLALCAEVVVHKLLTTYPNAAVMFLEMQTAIRNRKTAAVLHMGVAKHYQVPVISYAETMFPDFYRLMHHLRQYEYSTATIPGAPPNASAEPVLPYPHGCVPCIHEHMIESFRENGCKPLCIFAERSGEKGLSCKHPPAGREPCYVSFLSHDAVHLSVVGHQIAADLIAEAITTTARDVCRGRNYSEHILPTVGFMVSDPSTLNQHSDFVYVKDTMEIFSKQQPLESTNHSTGFALDGDFRDRPGWIATNPNGGEYVEYVVDLPQHTCYAVYLAVLKSYENMGTFRATVIDLQTNQETSRQIDSLWEPRISIPSDVQITVDDQPGCSGKCKVVVSTNPEISGRGGNKVKIVTLSARKCMIPAKTKKKN